MSSLEFPSAAPDTIELRGVAARGLWMAFGRVLACSLESLLPHAHCAIWGDQLVPRQASFSEPPEYLAHDLGVPMRGLHFANMPCLGELLLV